MRNTWDIFRDLEEMGRHLSRAVEHGTFPRRLSPAFRYSFLPGNAARTYPLINISEDKENVYIEALMPGIDTESLEVTTVRDQLTIAGEKPVLKDVKPEDYHRNERAAGRFTRSFKLSAEVDQDKASAQYENGILRLSLPKSEKAKPKHIAINMN
jgi:HSP20 family protein